MLLYLVLTNISKRSNVRSLLQVAASFNCSAVFVVGQRQFNFDVEGNDIPPDLRQHVASDKMPIVRFEKWDECVKHLRDENIELVGIEIHEKAVNIEDFSSQRNVAVLPGNEGQGIHPKHMKDCDSFVKISQYGGGTASLNVYVATSIVLSRYYERVEGLVSVPPPA